MGDRGALGSLGERVARATARPQAAVGDTQAARAMGHAVPVHLGAALEVVRRRSDGARHRRRLGRHTASSVT
jgi:hypothetical protein